MRQTRLGDGCKLGIPACGAPSLPLPSRGPTPNEEAGREAPMNQQREGPLSANAAISDGAVRLLHEYTGRGPTRSRTTINHDSVMIVLGDTLTKGEQKLVESGKAERVLQLRHDYQMTMSDDLIELVEH